MCAIWNLSSKPKIWLLLDRGIVFLLTVYKAQQIQAGVMCGFKRRGRGESRDYELYDYLGRYKRDDAGKPFTHHKWQAMRVESDLVHGVADTPLLVSGHGFELSHHFDGSLNRKWRLLTLRHEGVQPQAMGEDAPAASLASPVLVPPPLKGCDVVGGSYGLVRSHSMSNPICLLGREVQGGADGACRYSCAFTAQAADQRR